MKALALTRDQVRAVDQRAIEVYGMSGLVLMENAGRGCVDLLCRLGISGPVVICCGPGNNGGDGYVIARHLALRGFKTRVALFCNPDKLQGDAAANFQILQQCDVPIDCFDKENLNEFSGLLADADWIVDALLGTGTRGEPRSPLDRLIELLNASPARRLAVDLPSGLDCDTGQPSSITFQADHTCTFVAPKIGFSAASAQQVLGEVHVLDIGAPPRIVQEVIQGV